MISKELTPMSYYLLLHQKFVLPNYWFLKQAVHLIGQQQSTIKSIQERSGATIRIIDKDDLLSYQMVDERIVEIRGASLKVLNALKSVLRLLRKFLVDHGVLHLSERKNQAVAQAQDSSQENLVTSDYALPVNELNYDPVFMRDFAPSALAFLMKGEPLIVKNFLLETDRLQSREKMVHLFKLGQGVMPASFKVHHSHPTQKTETLLADFGEIAIGRVAPVDSGLWWIFLLHAYTKYTLDNSLSESPHCQRAMRLVLKLWLSEGFDTSPALLCADGCSMIDCRMVNTSDITEEIVKKSRFVKDQAWVTVRRDGVGAAKEAQLLHLQRRPGLLCSPAAHRRRCWDGAVSSFPAAPILRCVVRSCLHQRNSKHTNFVAAHIYSQRAPLIVLASSGATAASVGSS